MHSLDPRVTPPPWRLGRVALGAEWVLQLRRAEVRVGRTTSWGVWQVGGVFGPSGWAPLTPPPSVGTSSEAMAGVRNVRFQRWDARCPAMRAGPGLRFGPLPTLARHARRRAMCDGWEASVFCLLHCLGGRVPIPTHQYCRQRFTVSDPGGRGAGLPPPGGGGRWAPQSGVHPWLTLSLIPPPPGAALVGPALQSPSSGVTGFTGLLVTGLVFRMIDWCFWPGPGAEGSGIFWLFLVSFGFQRGQPLPQSD